MPFEDILLQPLPSAPARDYVQSLLHWKQQDPDIPQGQAAPTAIRRVGIVGLGIMGTAIAARHVAHGIPVCLADADLVRLAESPGRIAGQLGPAAAECSDLIEIAGDDRLAGCDLVLESIVESLQPKQQLYARLEPRLLDNALLASNTSTIPIAQLASGLVRPERFCGLHFFHPVAERRLVEVVRGPRTSDDTVASAVRHAKSIGQIPIVVRDGPGFLFNRLLQSYLNEALDLLLDGATLDQIERAACTFGMPMGPLRFLDEIGLDTALMGGLVLREAFPDRVVGSPLLIGMVKARRLGKKAQAGFFGYGDEGQIGPPDATVDRLIARWRRASHQLSPGAIVARLFLPMILEATRLLEEQMVEDPRDIDLGVLLGLGFPQARGGLLYWADAVGAGRLLEILRPLEPLGERMHPTRRLLEIAEAGTRIGVPKT